MVKDGKIGMTKSEVKTALDRIRDASDEDIAINTTFIKQVAEAAFSLIKSFEANQKPKTNKLKRVAEKYGLTQDGVDFALSQYQRVICEITHSRMSKLSYYANDILALANDLQCEAKETLDDSNVFAGDWISVKERLPNTFEPFYAACKSMKDDRENWTIEGIYKGTTYGGPWGVPMIEWGEAEVYAWMPKKLPEPPKEEKQDG